MNSAEATSVRLVELFGLPGAGKTTLLKALPSSVKAMSRHQLADSWARLSPMQKGRLVATAFIARGCLRSTLSLIGHANVARRDSVSRLLKIVIKAQWMRSQNGNVLLDQGPLQGLWSVLFGAGITAIDAKRLAPMLRTIYSGMNAAVVSVEVPPAVAAERVASRIDGHSRLDGLDPTAIGRRLSRAQQLPPSILEAAELAGLSVVKVDGTRPLDELVDEVRRLFT